MELQQATRLITHPDIHTTAAGAIWADLGCGTGMFTKALAHLLAPSSKIYAVDINMQALKKISPPNDIIIEKIQADFIHDELPLQDLDGILMANSLHYVEDKKKFIRKISRYIKRQGYFLIVEYDTDTPNPWVPYPLSYVSLRLLFDQEGYHYIQKIQEMPSGYNRSKIYAALITRNASGSN